jgi:universal stress protein A
VSCCMTMHAFARILVPVDFSACSDRALGYATAFARAFGARLELVHVVEDPFGSGAWSSEIYLSSATTIPEFLRDLTADAGRRLTALKARVSSEGIQIDTTVLSGSPERTIVEHAKTGGFDLIVMGTHGRTGLSHALIGSVAERIVRQAPCPVMVVRDEAPTTSHDEVASTAAETVTRPESGVREAAPPR